MAAMAIIFDFQSEHFVLLLLFILIQQSLWFPTKFWVNWSFFTGEEF